MTGVEQPSHLSLLDGAQRKGKKMNAPQAVITLGSAVLALNTATMARGQDFAYQTTVPGYYLASGHGVVADSDGNAYVIGKAYEDQVHLDILIIKLDPRGEVLWTNYIVGNGHDLASDLVLDDNNLYVTGWTDSDDFPVTADAMDGSLTGFRDAFLLRLSPDDGSILYGTFLGGDYVDRGEGIVLNDAGEIFIVGATKSQDFPVTSDAYQDQPNSPTYGYFDAFITKLSPEGDSILYSTYFGGYKSDQPMGLALDNAGNIIFAGVTESDDLPLANPINSSPNDLFISKLSADGTELQFSTYFGGEDDDGLSSLALDSDGYAYITGSTQSVAFPTTAGAFQEDFAGEILGCGNPPFVPLYNCPDVFVTKLSTDGAGLVYSTYLGGSSIESARDIAVDNEGRAYVIGYTSSGDFPPEGIDSSAEIFVYALDPTGGKLDLTVTIDSNSANAGHGIALNENGDLVFTGAVNVPADIYAAKINLGASCPSDVNSDSVVDVDDLFQVLSQWGSCSDCPEDINTDGVVDIDDVFAVLAEWGPCPGS